MPETVIERALTLANMVEMAVVSLTQIANGTQTGTPKDFATATILAMSELIPLDIRQELDSKYFAASNQTRKDQPNFVEPDSDHQD